MFASFAKRLVDTAEQLSSSLNQPSDANDPYFKGHTQGLRVVASADTRFHTWFDYIVAINGHDLPWVQSGSELTVDHHAFFSELGRGSALLTVWSAKGGVVRTETLHVEPVAQASLLPESPLRPDDEQAGGSADGPRVVVQQLFQALGLKLQVQPLVAATFVWHVLGVQPQTNSERLGLVPNSDYIVAMGHDGLLGTGGEGLLSKVLASYYSKYLSLFHYEHGSQPERSMYTDLTLFVYNHEHDVIRPVVVNFPSLTGMGAAPEFRLGCDVGYGYLHRLPEVLGTGSGVGLARTGDVLFDASSALAPPPVDPSAPAASPSSSPEDLLIPASLALQVATARPKRKGRVPAKVYGAHPEIGDYLEEELTKSRAADVPNANAKRGTDGAPPPPPPLVRE